MSDAVSASDFEVRRAAIKALGKIGPDARAAIPALIRNMKDENAFIREYSAESLGQIGPVAKEAVPQLIELLNLIIVESIHHSSDCGILLGVERPI